MLWLACVCGQRLVTSRAGVELCEIMINASKGDAHGGVTGFLTPQGKAVRYTLSR